MPTTGCLAARDSAALFDLRDRSQLLISGADRSVLLNNFCTNDVKKLTPGHGCEAFLCNVKGRVLGHVTVFCDDGCLVVESVPGAAATLAAHLDRYIIREDVVLSDASRELGSLCVAGPDSIELLGQWLKGADSHTGGIREQLQAMPMLGSLPFTNRQGDLVTVRQVDWPGTRAWLLCGSQSLLNNWWAELAGLGGVPGSSLDWDSLRIAAGWPHMGVDVSEENLPQEVARNERCISFTKGCYLGQEPIARLDALGHTNRELRRLMIDTDTQILAGSRLLAQDTQEPVGQLTSVAPAPFEAGLVALGYLKTRWSAPGSRVLVEQDSSEPATAIVR